MSNIFSESALSIIHKKGWKHKVSTIIPSGDLIFNDQGVLHRIPHDDSYEKNILELADSLPNCQRYNQ